MIYRKIFPTTRHSIHVWEPVRKATLNGPKVFGYFWAPKVTKNLNFVFCLAHFCHYLPINLAQIFTSQHDTEKLTDLYTNTAMNVLLVEGSHFSEMLRSSQCHSKL